jgi:hypothetical protein
VPEARRRSVSYDGRVDGLSIGMKRLSVAQTKDELVDALWDLRDSACDTPEAWSGFTAEAFLQGLTGELDEAPAGDEDQISVLILSRAFAKGLGKRWGGS